MVDHRTTTVVVLLNIEQSVLLFAFVVLASWTNRSCCLSSVRREGVGCHEWTPLNNHCVAAKKNGLLSIRVVDTTIGSCNVQHVADT